MRVSDDESIFAWQDGRNNNGAGLLAGSPAAFADSGLVSLPTYPTHDAAPFSMSNRGLRLETYTFPCSDPSWPGAVDDTYFVPLNCRSHEFGPVIALYLRRLEGSQFTRIMPNVLHELEFKQQRELEQCWETNRPKTVLYVKQSHGSDTPLHGPYTVRIDLSSLIRGGFDMLKRGSPPRFQWTDGEALDSDKSGMISDVTYEEKLISSTLSILDSIRATLFFSSEHGTKSFFFVAVRS